jgi:hypothetical protein
MGMMPAPQQPQRLLFSQRQHHDPLRWFDRERALQKDYDE